MHDVANKNNFKSSGVRGTAAEALESSYKRTTGTLAAKVEYLGSGKWALKNTIVRFIPGAATAATFAAAKNAGASPAEATADAVTTIVLPFSASETNAAVEVMIQSTGLSDAARGIANTYESRSQNHFKRAQEKTNGGTDIRRQNYDLSDLQ